MNQSASNATAEFNLTEWIHSPGSIYVKYVPTHMDKEELTYIFCEIGKVSRVDIVNSAPNKITGSWYRMAFIHFDFWHRDEFSMGLRDSLAIQFPNPVSFNSRHYLYALDTLTLMINTRPVPKTVYNVDQLSDMYHRLREEYTSTVAQLREEINELKQMVIRQTRNTAHSDSHIIDIPEDQMTFERPRNGRDPIIFKEMP